MNPTLIELFFYFLRLGCTAFGGPAVHIATMQRELVEQKKWLDEVQFKNLLAAVQLIPGPNSTELALHIGYEKKGVLGLILVGIGFITPAVVLTLICAVFYNNYSDYSLLNEVMKSIQPALAVIVFLSIYKLFIPFVEKLEHIILGLIVLVCSSIGVSEIQLLFGGAVLYYVIERIKINSDLKSNGFLLFGTVGTVKSAWLWSFFKIGTLLYGSGYVIFSLMNEFFVETGQLEAQVVRDAIAVGQFTPGPVFSSVTFVGYQLGGLNVAILATLIVFIPAFLLVGFLPRFMVLFQKIPHYKLILDGLVFSSILLIFLVSKEMMVQSFSFLGAFFALISALVLLFIPKLNSGLLIIFLLVTSTLIHYFL